MSVELQYRDRGDCHLQVRQEDDGDIELRVVGHGGDQHKVRLSAQTARELLNALLLILQPRH
jgi:hypothetical protein